MTWLTASVRTGFDRSGRTVGEPTEEVLRESEELYHTVAQQSVDNIFLVDVQTKRILEANTALQRSLGYSSDEFENMTLYDVVAHDRESIDRNTERILKDGCRFIGERRYRRKDGSLASVQASASAISYRGRKAMCVVAHDLTEHKRTEENLRRSLDVMLALREAGQVLGSTLEAEEIATRLLTIMRGVSSLTAAVISVPDEGKLCRVWRSVGLEGLPSKARYHPAAEAARRAVLETGEPRSFSLQWSDPEYGRLTGLCLPVLMQERIAGVLEGYGPPSLTENEQVEILSSLTAQAGSALENARLYGELAERERRLEVLVGELFHVQEEERRRVAYEVHDGLAQVAAAAYQHLQGFARFHPPDSEKGQELLDRAVEMVQRTVGEARRVIAALRPTALDDFGLQTAIRHEAEMNCSDDSNVVYQSNMRDDERLPTAVETALFRITQEALTNVRRHAKARRVRLSLNRLKGKVRLTIRDWGQGFDSALKSDGGPGERVGLSSMRERVDLLGGNFRIHSRLGVGTLLRIDIPLPEENSIAKEMASHVNDPALRVSRRRDLVERDLGQ